MKLQRVLKRISAFFLALLLMVCTPVGDYLYVRDVMPVYASGAAMTAFQWIWAAILAACGVTTTDPVSIDSIADGVSRWVDSLTDEVHKAEYKLILESIQKASWGIEFNRAYQAVQMVKAFLMLKDGYDTDTGIDNIIVSGKISYDSSYCVRNGYDCTLAGFSSDNYYLSLYVYQSGSPSYWAKRDFFIDLSDSDFRYAAYPNTNNSHSYNIRAYKISTGKLVSQPPGTGYINFRTDSLGTEYYDSYFIGLSVLFEEKDREKVISSFPIPIYTSLEAAMSYLNTGIVGNPVNDYTAVRDDKTIPVDSKTEVQSRPIQQAGALRVPATMEEAYAQYIDFTGATTPDELVTALNPSWDITYGKDDTQTGDKDDTFPWVPDITGALNAIKDIITGIASPLTGIEKLIMEIPKILTDIYNGVISIPDQITAFFTIDTAQINTAQAELVAAFKSKFPALYGLSDIFNFSREFTDTIPVISISVPAFLKFAYPNDDRIVIFDLTAYKEWFDFGRNIISAILWIAFVRWLLEQFDVKFGVN